MPINEVNTIDVFITAAAEPVHLRGIELCVLDGESILLMRRSILAAFGIDIDRVLGQLAARVNIGGDDVVDDSVQVYERADCW